MSEDDILSESPKTLIPSSFTAERKPHINNENIPIMAIGLNFIFPPGSVTEAVIHGYHFEH